MDKQQIAHASTTIEAPVDRVWDALVNPEKIKKYMFGADVVSEWEKGSEITWTGEWKGTPYEDKGKILEIEPPTVLEYSHFSPLSGLADRPESYHRVQIELTAENGKTRVELSQDNNESDDARCHSEENWKMMLAGLKKVVEQR